jgi:hypothetical protein
MCNSHFCDKHLLAPKNTLTAGQVFNCPPCARRTNELAFTECVQKGLALIFSTGIAAVTITSPKGVTARYTSSDVHAAVLQDVPEDFDLGEADLDDATLAVTPLETGEVMIEGIATIEALEAVLADMKAKR